MLNHISTIWEYRDFLTIHKSHLDGSQLKLLKSKYRHVLSKFRKLDISLASDISLALLIRLILLLTMILSFALLATILICQTLLLYLSLLRKNLRISLPKVKTLFTLSKMTLLLFAINTETVQSSTETACYIPCNLFLTLLTFIPSLDMVLIKPSNSTLSGDGSLLHIHASFYGHKVQDALDSGNNYHFSSLDADIGWDSDLAQYFFFFFFLQYLFPQSVSTH